MKYYPTTAQGKSLLGTKHMNFRKISTHMLQVTFRGTKNMETTKNVANFNPGYPTQLPENEPWIAEVTT
jgi:hypothetical protein